MIHFLKLTLGGAATAFFGIFWKILSLIVVNIMLDTGNCSRSDSKIYNPDD
jgi:hypothetical protein